MHYEFNLVTSRTRRATSPSTTATWTASSTTSSGPRRIWRGRGGCSPGARRRQHLVGFRLGRLLGLLGQGGVVWVVGGASIHVADGLMDNEYGERRVVGRRFGRGPFQGLAGMTGAIDSDNDARHVNLLFTQ